MHRYLLTDGSVVWAEPPRKPASGYELPGTEATWWPGEDLFLLVICLARVEGLSTTAGLKGGRTKVLNGESVWEKNTGRCRLMLVGQWIMSPQTSAILDPSESAGVVGLSSSEWCSLQTDSSYSTYNPYESLHCWALQGRVSYWFQSGTISFVSSSSLISKRRLVLLEGFWGEQKSTNICRLGQSRSLLALHLHTPYQRQALRVGWACLWEGLKKGNLSPLWRWGGSPFCVWHRKMYIFQAESNFFFFFLSSQGGLEWVSRTATPLTTQIVDTGLGESDVHYFKASCLYLYIVRQWPSLCGRMNYQRIQTQTKGNRKLQVVGNF